MTLAGDDTELSCSCVSKKAAKAAGHFDLSDGATFEQVAAERLAFLRQHLVGADG
jgi:hypothetical protein